MARLALPVQVISSHPLFIQAVEGILARPREFQEFQFHILPHALSAWEVLNGNGSPRLFLLDGCSLRADLGRVAVRCRASFPGSKVLALLSPENGGFAEKSRLFHWGIDGFVELHRDWEAELIQAIRSILNGQLWVPSEVLLAFVKQAKALLDAQLLPGHSLTAREAQILQLLMRGLPNKDISDALDISPRTVKFHVSNILSKLQIEDRRGLLPDRLALKTLASEA
jgi:DNA-binding NarL/FixJ family response regulator